MVLRGLESVQACAKKQFFGPWKIVFRKTMFQAVSSSYWGKQCFRSPSLSTYGFWVEWKQSKHARKKQFFGAWKIDFLQSLRFLQAIEENNVSGPQAYPHMVFGWNGSSPNMRAKNNFSEPEKMIFCKASVFFKLLRKTMFQVPKPIHIWFSGGMGAVQPCAQPEKLFFCKAQFHPVRQYKGPRQKKMNR